MRKYFFFLSLFVFISAIMPSCLQNQYEKDIEIIEEYIEKHNLDIYNIDVDEFGLHYIETKPGIGTNTLLTDSVVFSYSLRLHNDIEVSFARADEPYATKINDLVRGLQLGLLKMNEGGEAVILMPSELGYGAYSYFNPNTGTIPPNAVLIFYINLHEVIRK